MIGEKVGECKLGGAEPENVAADWARSSRTPSREAASGSRPIWLRGEPMPPPYSACEKTTQDDYARVMMLMRCAGQCRIVELAVDLRARPTGRRGREQSHRDRWLGIVDSRPCEQRGATTRFRGSRWRRNAAFPAGVKPAVWPSRGGSRGP